MNEYATLGQLRAYLEASNLTMADADDRKLLQYLTWASRRVERYCHGRKFFPWSETRYEDYQEDTTVLILGEDLLELTTLTVDGVEISSSYYYLYPRNRYPKWRVEMDKGSGEIFTFSDTPQDAITLAGTWGWHDDYGNAWVDSGDTLQANIDESATELTAGDVDGANVEGWEPRVSAGHLLKIDSEYLSVTETDVNDDTVTVQRGANGTTAASHSSGATIYIYRPPEIVSGATLDLAKWIYEHRSAVGGILALPSLEGAAVRAEVTGMLEVWQLPRRLSRINRR